MRVLVLMADTYSNTLTCEDMRAKKTIAKNGVEDAKACTSNFRKMEDYWLH